MARCSELADHTRLLEALPWRRIRADPLTFAGVLEAPRDHGIDVFYHDSVSRPSRGDPEFRHANIDWAHPGIHLAAGRVKTAVARVRTQKAAPGSGPVRRAVRSRREKRLDGGFVLLAGADADHFLHRSDEDFAVADFAGARGFGDGLDAGFGLFLGDDDLDFDLG